MTFARVLGYDSHDIQATAVAQGQSHWVWVPLAIDSQTLSPGLEADLGFKNCASGHFWRVVVPNATDADFEGLVRDGVASRLNIGDSVDLDPNTEAVKTEIENAVNSRLQAAPGSAGTDPSIIQVPIVADMTNIDFYAPRKSVKVVGFASLRLIRVDDTQLKLRYVSPSSPPAPSGSSGPLVQ
jgi:hypothetical protein